MRPSSARLAAVILAAVSFSPLLSHAGLFDDEEARKAILDARTRIEATQRDLTTRLDAKADKSSLLDLASQNEQLRTELAKLRGQIEVLTNEVTNAQQRQKDFYVDLDNRLRKFEAAKGTGDGRDASAGGAGGVDSGDQRIYEAALAQFKAGDYRDASTGFSQFLQRYPQSGYAGAAQYWLGNTYYALRDCRSAIASHQLVLKNYPDSTRAPDALLNISNCYIEMKDKPQARKALETLVVQYPDSPAAQTARERLPGLRQ